MVIIQYRLRRWVIWSNDFPIPITFCLFLYISLYYCSIFGSFFGNLFRTGAWHRKWLIYFLGFMTLHSVHATYAYAYRWTRIGLRFWWLCLIPCIFCWPWDVWSNQLYVLLEFLKVSVWLLGIYRTLSLQNFGETEPILHGFSIPCTLTREERDRTNWNQKGLQEMKENQCLLLCLE